jgi:hypothetical protein
MGYPVGPLLQTLAARILANLEDITDRAPKPDAENMNDPPYADTQLLVSLLGVLVFPQERVPGSLGRALLGYPDLGEIVKVKYSAAGPKRASFTNEAGELETIDATQLDQLPRLLRNGIAHFNIRPLAEGERFGGIRIWNEWKGTITFVADIAFDDLRPFAVHMLKVLAAGGTSEPLDDPTDPLERLPTAKNSSLTEDTSSIGER